MGSWPDTTQLDRPDVDNQWHRARWLVGRHPVLARLLARVPDVVDWQDDGPWVDLEVLVQAIRDVDAYNAAWEDYRARTWEPREEARWGQWHADGPAASITVDSIVVMSRTEQARLRLLATLGGRVEFSIDVAWGFDEDGQRLLADWCTLVTSQ